jgi:hypothetical protein
MQCLETLYLQAFQLFILQPLTSILRTQRAHFSGTYPPAAPGVRSYSIFASNSAASRAAVALLQDTMTTRSGAILGDGVNQPVGDRPLRGGSTSTTSGRRPSAVQDLAAALAAYPVIKRALVMPFRAALRRAFSMASGTISTPITCPALCCKA